MVKSPDEKIWILDFGSQYVQLIARTIRENRVFSKIVPHDVSADEVRDANPKGLVLSGGPASVYGREAPTCDAELLRLGLPILGICYGMQLGCELLGGKVSSTGHREYGRTTVKVLDREDLFAGLPDEITAWMSHGDLVERIPDGCKPLASTESCPHAAVRLRERNFYGVHFHPEVSHTPLGSEILRNFLYNVCGCEGRWQMHAFIEKTVEELKETIGDDKVICGLSGGVDSSVAAALLHRAVGDQLICILVDNGLLRKGEAERVVQTFQRHFGMELHVLDAADRFLQKLKGVADPEQKRMIIGHEFIEAFKGKASEFKGIKFLAQGTLYPDVIESRSPTGGPSDKIKTHHNVGGLPAELGFELVEPLRYLFKDEVRQIGQELGLPDDIVWRHPFPGPGLGVRVIGEVTPERLGTLRQADAILLEELRKAGLYRKVAQCFAVLLPVGSVGVMGDSRTYENVIAIRAVETADFMTADWARLPNEVLATISNRIINEVQGVNRVVYDISTKPPSTIEWE